MRHFWKPLTLILGALLATPVAAQQDAMHWHQDLESAKVVAKETKRLLLIHFWTPSCGPCMALERSVFNQPGVAAAIEAQFVPVKLNADENSATAQWYGITRVPTDVVATPDGQIITKMVSPPTPSAYVAGLADTASKYNTRLGQTYAAAASAAPVQSQLNSAYAKLPVGQNAAFATAPQATATSPGGTPMPILPPLAGAATVGNNPTPSPSPPPTTPGFATVPAPTSPVAAAITQPTTRLVPAMPVAQSVPSTAPSTVANTSPIAPPPLPQTVLNPAVASASAPTAQPTPITPIGPAPTSPSQFQNQYVAAAPSAGAAIMAQPNTPSLQSAATPSLAAQTVPQYNRSEIGPPTPSTEFQPAASASVATNGPTSGTPDAKLLPPGAPPLAFEGYCPVSMRNQWKWVPGNPQYGIVHLGRTYWFAGAEEQKQFWADPARYAPVLSGNDPVMAIDHQQQVPGKREHSLDYDGLFYMFASEATLQQFAANPAKYAAGVRQAMGIPRGRLVR